MTNKLINGAKNVVNQCIKLVSADHIVIITDRETLEVGNALLTEARLVTKNVLFLVIEDYTKRPAVQIPQEMLNEIIDFKPTISIYAAQGKEGELPVFRRPLTDLFTKEFKCKHAHMISITKELMEVGMNQDYDMIYRVTHKVYDIVKDATLIEVSDPYGTNITYELDPTNIQWVPDDGRIKPIHWANLPGGEVFTAIKNCNGKIVSWILGDTLSRFGELTTPLIITIKDSYITDIEGETEVKEAFEKYVSEYEFGKRCGELGIGTLVGLERFVGNLLQDEKFPGVHMAFGSPYPEKTGATWECPSHIDVIAKETTIKVTTPNESKIIMVDGKYIPEILN